MVKKNTHNFFSRHQHRLLDMASQSSKKKCSAYDASLKLKVVGYAEIHGKRAASRDN